MLKIFYHPGLNEIGLECQGWSDELIENEIGDGWLRTGDWIFIGYL